jgi:hypothetical protein
MPCSYRYAAYSSALAATVRPRQIRAMVGVLLGFFVSAEFITTLLMLRCEERSSEPRSTHRRRGAVSAWCVLRGSRCVLAPQDEAEGRMRP